jgi:CheY-like chemotaxis protein
MSKQGQTILYVEDDEDTIKVYRDIFQRRAETVIDARDDQEPPLTTSVFLLVNLLIQVRLRRKRTRS